MANKIEYVGKEALKYTLKKLLDKVSIPSNDDDKSNLFNGFTNLIDTVELDDNNVVVDEISFNSIFVSPSGNNTSGDGSKNKPFKTIAKALNTAKAGQTIWIREGTYTENIVFNKSGKEGKPITLRNYPNEVAKIDLTDKTVESVIDFNSQSNINIIGLELCNLKQKTNSVVGIFFPG